MSRHWRSPDRRRADPSEIVAPIIVALCAIGAIVSFCIIAFESTH